MNAQLVEMNIAPRPDSQSRVDFRRDVPMVVTTQAFDWPGLRLEAGINNIAAVDEAAGLHHYVSMNFDERPVTLEVKDPLGHFHRVVLRRGAAWICPAGELVSLRVNSNFHYVRMSIDPAYFHRLIGEPGAAPIELRRAYSVSRSQIGYLLSALVAESDAGNPGGLPFVEALATALSHQVALHAGVRKPSIARARGGLSAAAKRTALEMMAAQLDGQLTVEDLARAVGLSPAHFSRAFRETVGQPPHRHLLALRLEHARRLLEYPDAALANVAQRTGFADQAHFTRLFKREFGMTPGALQRVRRGSQTVRQ
jgi:AraC family transcriptional regulator